MGAISKQLNLRVFYFGIVSLLLSGGVVYLVAKKALIGFLAGFVLTNFGSIDVHGLDREIKSSVQKHFSGYRIYIPHEDIHTSNEKVSKQLDKRCGEGKVYIWVPLEFNLYSAGIKVYEWCIALK